MLALVLYRYPCGTSTLPLAAAAAGCRAFALPAVVCVIPCRRPISCSVLLNSWQKEFAACIDECNSKLIVGKYFLLLLLNYSLFRFVEFLLINFFIMHYISISAAAALKATV